MKPQLSSLLVFGALIGIVVASCSDKGPPDRFVDGTGAANNAGGDSGAGLATGSGGGLVIIPGTGGNSGDMDGGGGSGPPPPVVLPPEILVDCEVDADCCPKIEGCMNAAEYVCTIEKKCGKVSGTCTSDADCLNDTYCYDQACPTGSALQGQCIPNFVPGCPRACERPIEPGVFAPSIQCSWVGPPANDPYPQHSSVLATPVVADWPIGPAAEIVIVTYNSDINTAQDSVDKPISGVLRILRGDTCELLQTFQDPQNPLRASAAPAIGDINGDGHADIVARRGTRGLVAYAFNAANNTFDTLWSQSTDAMDIADRQAWDGPSIHDIDNQGPCREVILRDSVYDGCTGARRANIATNDANSAVPFNGYIPILGNLDGDANTEMFTNLGWNPAVVFEFTGSAWQAQFPTGGNSWFGDTNGLVTHAALGDFGSLSGSNFTATLDGLPELISVNAEDGGGRGPVRMYSYNGTTWQAVLRIDTVKEPSTATCLNEGGGPPVVGNFDGDVRPEFAIAGATRLRVFDLDLCNSWPCGAEAIAWSQPSQDCSSRQTGASIFDFDGDSQAEVIYADECFVRVYRGTTGDVLFSGYRTSGTWYEYPIVADVDRDEHAELVVNSTKQAVRCPTSSSAGARYVDPLHAGVSCDDDSQCLPGSSCVENLCRCTSDSQCCGSDALEQCGLSCAPSISGGSNTCRATHPNSAAGRPGIRVLKDRLDRWASARVIWNQHAYSITNVNDDGTIPLRNSWQKNWTAGYNNYRQQKQGVGGVELLPDITGRFLDTPPCVVGGSSSKVYLQAVVCNRGQRDVGSYLPGTFYVGDPANNDRLCTSYTSDVVPKGSCLPVLCQVDDTSSVEGKTITFVVNRDENGAEAVFECRPDNNTSTIAVTTCPPVEEPPEPPPPVVR